MKVSTQSNEKEKPELSAQATNVSIETTTKVAASKINKLCCIPNK